MVKWEHCTPTYIFNQLTDEAMFHYCGSHTYLRKLIKRALGSDIVRSAILEEVGEYMVDEATEKITDTKAPGK